MLTRICKLKPRASLINIKRVQTCARASRFYQKLSTSTSFNLNSAKIARFSVKNQQWKCSVANLATLASVTNSTTTKVVKTDANIMTATAGTPAAANVAKSNNNTDFRLDDSFVNSFIPKLPFVFPNVIAEMVYRRTYSRTMENGNREQWHDTIRRVVEGAFQMQKNKITSQNTRWDEEKAQRSAQKMFSAFFSMKCLPPGRGLWAMGSPLTRERGMNAAVNNCGFVSTNDMWKDPTKPFRWLKDNSMLGVGVGFDLEGAKSQVVTDSKTGVKTIHPPRQVVCPNRQVPKQVHVVTDDREGWVEALRLTMDPYFTGSHEYKFDVSKVRKAGELIKGFGGVASGPAALLEELEEIKTVLNGLIGGPITETAIVDIMNIIGKCVVAGNVRRTAEIAMGPSDSQEYLDLKNYAINPRRKAWGWASNNTVFAIAGQDYSEICKRIRINGEPGLAWLENMQQFSRMNSEFGDNKDYRVLGTNPCSEQSLESFELCCLGEMFITNNLVYDKNNKLDVEESLKVWKESIKSEFLYTKTVTLGTTHWPETNEVMGRNRRIGLSITGIAQFLSISNIHTLIRFYNEGYQMVQECDRKYSEWFQIPKSIKTTSIKPSGTVSLLAGVTPGVHYPEAQYYIRRMRLAKTSDLVPKLEAAGYHIEPAVDQPTDTVVVSVPISAGNKIRTVSEVSMWEQLQLTMLTQKHWADNQVSSTVTFDPETEGHQLEHALNYAQYGLKSVSFLPRVKKGAYAQMPYEGITKEKYEEMSSKLKPVNFSDTLAQEKQTPERFCNNDTCEAKDI